MKSAATCTAPGDSWQGGCALKAEARHLDEDTLNLLVDQAIEGEDLRAAQEHLASCPTCARRLAGLKTLCLAVESLPDMPFRRDISEEVVASIWRRNRARPWPLLALGGAQGLLAAAVLSAVWGQVVAAMDSIGQATFGFSTSLWTSWGWPSLMTWWFQARAEAMGQCTGALTAMNRLVLHVSGVSLPEAVGLALTALALAVAGNALLVGRHRGAGVEA
jgi:anti-sigma factor RsiW